MLHRHKVWQQPDRGLLFGTIQVIHNNQQFKLRDLEQKDWTIFHSQSQNMPRPIILVPGMRIKTLGNQIDQNSFQAEIIRPLRNSPQRMLLMENLRFKP